MRLEICSFSGYKIYPGKGKLFARSDSKILRFITSKCEAYHSQKLNPRHIDWTVFFRRLRKKGQSEQVVKQKQRKIVKLERTFAGVDMAALKAKMKPVIPKPEKAAVEAAKKKDNSRKGRAAKPEKSKSGAPKTEGSKPPKREGSKAPKAEGPKAPKPEGSKAPKPEGSKAPKPEGSKAPKPEGSKASRGGGRRR